MMSMPAFWQRLAASPVLLYNELDFFLGEFLFRHTNEGAGSNVDRRGIGVKLVFTRCTPLVGKAAAEQRALRHAYGKPQAVR